MPRRKTSPGEDFIEAVSRFPWWVGIGLAIVSYLILHWIVGWPVVQPTGLQGVAAVAGQSLIRVFAGIAQYLLPILFLGGAAVSAIAQAKKRSDRGKIVWPDTPAPVDTPTPTGPVGDHDLYEIWRRINSSPIPRADTWSLELLRSIDWKRFEEVCAEYFRLLGFRAVTQGHGPDGGIDITLFAADDPKRVEGIVQCKQWSRQIGPKLIRELLGVMTDNRVPAGIFVTSSAFNDEAIRLAAANNIDLIDSERLLELIHARPTAEQARLFSVATEGDYLTPTCPNCGIKLVKRESRKDNSVFWGCANYPRCRVMLNT